MILLISIKTLKERYLVDDNLEDKYIIPNIQKGQDFIIKPLLGKTLYDNIIDQIINGTTSSETQELLEKIEPILAYYVMSEIFYITAYKFKNKGIEGDGKFEELIRISRKYLKDSEAYQQLLDECVNGKKVIKTGLYLG